MLKKILSMVLVLSIICINLCATVSFAASVPVTEENLQTALQNFVSLGDSTDNKVSVKNHKILAHINGEDYSITYDLNGNPVFIYTVDVKQGMSYQDFQEKISGLSSVMLGYIAVANIQGVSVEDAAMYYTMQLMTAAFSGTSSMDLSDTYVIVGDEVTVEGDNSKVIKESKFGKRVMEYVNAVYAEKTSVVDSEGINSFEYTVERQDVTKKSCKLVSTLTVNLEADFSQIEGTVKALEDAFGGGLTSDTPKLTDIAGTKYEEAVKSLVELKVVNGFEDNTFRPTENVTRAQFAKMLVEALHLEAKADAAELTFTDLSDAHWAYNYIKTAVDNGIINGYPDNTFKPDNSVTYAESMAMILRAMKLEETMADKSWPMGYINEAKDAGLLESVDYSEPNVPANRGETAISLYNMIQKIKEANSKLLNATYSNENGSIVFEELENGQVDFTFTGLANGEEWTLGMPLDFANGVASANDDFFDDIVKIKIVFENDSITVEASSTDSESGYNGINGVYLLEK